MPHEYEIECSDPSTSRCDCCGGLAVRLTRFVYRDGDAFAIYYAAYSNNHPDGELAMLISLGDWGEDSDPAQRAAFYCRVCPTGESYGVTLGDASHSIWSDAGVVGQKLSREEALRHEWKAMAFEVLDEAFLHDVPLRGFLHRAQCGSIAVPLEKNFRMPDDVFALGDERQTRAELRGDFASLDGERFFVRCLLPLLIEGYGSWRIGMWVEVSKPDYQRVREAWNVPEQYSALQFSGTIANNVKADLDLPIGLGVDVELHVPNPKGVPMVKASGEGTLTAVLSKEWSKTEFEEYAVARGFL
jgi:hypothetical protein